MPHARTSPEEWNSARRLVCAAPFCAAFALFCETASGQATPSFSLEWEAPPECPSAAAVERDVAQILSASSAPTAALRARGVASRTSPDKWRADLVLRGVVWEAHRTLEGATCAAVAEAAAVVIALAINPQIEPPAPKVPPPKPMPPSKPTAQPEAVPTPEQGEHFVHRPPAGPFLGVGVVSDLGTLPGAAFGAEGWIGWQIAALRFDVGGSYFLSKRGTLPRHSDIGATFQLAAMGQRSCYQWAYESISVGPCLDVGLTWTRAEGFGPIVSYRVSTVGFSLGADMALAWQLSRFLRPYFRLSGALPVARPEFAVQGLETLHRAAIVSVRGVIGIEAQLE